MNWWGDGGWARLDELTDAGEVAFDNPGPPRFHVPRSQINSAICIEVREMDHKVRWMNAVLIAVALIVGGRGGGVLVSAPPTVSGLYVANAGANSVTVYASGASGNTTPLRTIKGPSTGLTNPNSSPCVRR